jgi:hypothetical protein
MNWIVTVTHSQRKVPTFATAEALVLSEASVILAIAALTSFAYSELACRVRPVKGFEPGASVTAEAQAARASRRDGSRFSIVSVGAATANAARAAKQKEYFIMETEIGRQRGR